MKLYKRIIQPIAIVPRENNASPKTSQVLEICHNEIRCPGNVTEIMKFGFSYIMKLDLLNLAF